MITTYSTKPIIPDFILGHFLERFISFLKKVVVMSEVTGSGKGVILANEAFGTLVGKLGNDLVYFPSKYEIVAVIDGSKVGKDAGEVLGIGKKNIPIIGSLEESLRFGPDALILGTAPSGGQIPEEWRKIIKTAVVNGLNIVNGMHNFLNEDPEISSLAKKHGTKLYDLRKPPKILRLAQGEVKKIKVPIIATCATDHCSGNNVAIQGLLKEAKKRGYNPGFVSTGQTTMILNSDVGEAIDPIPIDFASGEVEKLVLECAAINKDMIFVEGQGALSHLAYGPDTLAILYGALPSAMILIHDPYRETSIGFPMFKVTDPNEEIRLVEGILPSTKVVGIAIGGDIGKKSDEEIKAVTKKVEEHTGLPAVDVLRFGGGKLIDAIEKHHGIKPKGS